MLEFRRTPFSTFCKVLKLNVENNSTYCIFRDKCILRSEQTSPYLRDSLIGRQSLEVNGLRKTNLVPLMSITS